MVFGSVTITQGQGRREKRPAASEATRASLHYVYNCSVLKATSHVSCEATPPLQLSSLGFLPIEYKC